MFGCGLFPARAAPRRQALTILVACLTLANPGIQAVNTIAALVRALGLLPCNTGLLRPTARSRISENRLSRVTI